MKLFGSLTSRHVTLRLHDTTGARTGRGFGPDKRHQAPASTMRWRVATLLAFTLAATLGPAGAADQEIAPQEQTVARFAIISDPHLYNARLGTSGSAFENYLNLDPKLLKQSQAILDAALEAIVQQRVQFLIISGDLTKDGELVNHLLMARYLAKLERRGIKVFVTPGNHDINNPDAMRFYRDKTRRVASVNPQLFRAIYHRFGYGEAIARDAHSLSYLAEPVRGVWLLAIDSCKYEENRQLGYPVVGGRIKPETMTWIQDILETAKTKGKRVVAFMHHGVNQHFLGEAQLFPDYLVDDWPAASAQLAGTGLKVVFTGHYHSQDAAYPLDDHEVPQPTLCDVETASLASFPSAFRTATLRSDGVLDIRSQRVTQIRADTGGVPFQQYAESFLRARLPALVTYQLMAMFEMPQEQAAQVAPLVVDALVANYAGDEVVTPEVEAMLTVLLGSPEPMHTLGLLLSGIWTDLPPSDATLAITLGGS